MSAQWEELKAALNDPASSSSGNTVYGRNWNQWCQALVWQMCRLFGSAPHAYGTAIEARLASGTLNHDRNAAPAGSIHYWTQNHVGISLGGEYVLMASLAVEDKWTPNGTVGVTTVTKYGAVKGLEYAGWSATNGVNSITISDTYGAAAPVAVGGTQRQVLSNLPLKRRTLPTTLSPEAGAALAPGTIGNFNGWVHGEAVSGNDVWLRGISGNWFWSGGFTDSGTHDLADLNTPAVVPAGDTPPVPIDNTPPPVPEYIPPYAIACYGIDVGTSQAGINFVDVKAGGYSFVIVKMGGNNVSPQYVSPHYMEQVDAARAAGLYIGHYYAIGSGLTPTEQAEYFIANLHGFDITRDILALDNEPLNTNATQWNDAQVVEFFQRVIVLTGMPATRLWHYSSAAQFRGLRPWTVTESLGIKPWWASFGANPVLPRPDHAPDLQGAVADWLVHQFSSSVPIGGIPRVDVNASRLTADVLFATGVVTPLTPPVVTPPVVTPPVVTPPSELKHFLAAYNEFLTGYLNS